MTFFMSPDLPRAYARFGADGAPLSRDVRNLARLRDDLPTGGGAPALPLRSRFLTALQSRLARPRPA